MERDEAYWRKTVDWWNDTYGIHEPFNEWAEWVEALEVAPTIKTLVDDPPQCGMPPRPMTDYHFCSFLWNYVNPDRREIMRALTWQLIENDLIDLLAMHSRSRKQ